MLPKLYHSPELGVVTLQKVKVVTHKNCTYVVAFQRMCKLCCTRS